MNRIALAAMIGLTALSARAEQQDEGWYAGGAIAFANFGLGSNTIDDSSIGFRVDGGYRVNDNFGVEAAYLRNGEFEEDTILETSGGVAKVDIRGWSLDAIGYLPLAGLDLYGKLGYYRFDENLTLDGVPDQSRTADGFTVGTGVNMAIAEHVKLRAEFDWYDIDDADLWTVNLGIDYHFGGPR